MRADQDVTVLTALVRREIVRAALRLWITPFEAALAITGIALSRDSRAFAGSLASTADRTCLILDLRKLLTLLFLSLLCSFCLFRFSADLCVAILSFPYEQKFSNFFNVIYYQVIDSFVKRF